MNALQLASAVQLRKILDRFNTQSIAVLGDVGLDRYTLGRVERISPEAPVPVVAVEREWLKLGLAANVAENLRVLGLDCEILGVIGKDRNGEDFKSLCSERGLGLEGCLEIAGRRTVLKERIVTEQQQLLRVDYETSASLEKNDCQSLLDALKALKKKAKILIVEDYAKGLISSSLFKEVVNIWNDEEHRVFVDPNSKTDLKTYVGASVLTPNRKEAEALIGFLFKTEADLERGGRAILDRTQADTVIITRGKEGMTAFVKDDPKALTIPTFAREVYDVSGAGDTVIALLAAAFSAGASLKEAMILANVGAGIVVGKRGTATVSRDEIESELQGN